jgi:small subunit ribosomal protein S5
MNPKTSKPDRKQRDRKGRRKEPSDFEETTLTIDRVTRVVAGGRRMRFRAVVVVGDKKGRVGIGTGKANEVQAAVQKASAVAKRNMIRIPVEDGSIPHEIDHKFKAARIRLIPAREGTGIIAGGALRVVLEHAGIRNVLSKRYGTTNKLVNAQCTIKALMRIAGATTATSEDSAKNKDRAGKSNKDLGLKDTPELEKVKIKEVSKADIGRDGGLEKKK